MAKLGVDPDDARIFYDGRYNSSYMREHMGLEARRINCILNEIPGAIRTVLDYGCGQGGWTETVSKRFPQAELCGIDISSKAIALAAARHPGRKFLAFDGTAAPLPDSSFDLIFSHHAFEHVCDIGRTVSDASRLLKKGGYLCAVLPCANRNSFEERITRLVRNGKEASIDGRKRFFYDDAGHIRRLSSDELIGLFAANSIEIYKELYAYQFWGAVEWISKSGPAVICEMFNHMEGINFSAKMKLLALRMIFLLLSMPMKLYMTDLPGRIKSEKRTVKKITFLALMPVRPLVLPFGAAIDLLSFMEWRFCRTARNGSAQYLIFRK